MKLTKSKLKEIIREELLKEATSLDRAYDNWHDACYALNKAVRKTKDHKLMKAFAKSWDNADTALLGWMEDQGPHERR
jgi:hypothetical protein